MNLLALTLRLASAADAGTNQLEGQILDRNGMPVNRLDHDTGRPFGPSAACIRISTTSR